MGFDESRGDTLQVINSPFVEEQAVDDALPWWRTPEAYNLTMGVLRYLLVALAALTLWKFVLKPMQQRNAAAGGRDLMLSDEAGEPAPGARASDSLVVGQDNPQRPALPRKSALYEQNMESLKRLATEDPRLVAMIVRGWMKKHE